VGDEAVHKELGDIMERAAATASSLEAEQDSGSGPRCQDTILGDVNAQTRFEITSKQSIDPPLSRGYTLGSGEDSMKLIGIDEILLKLVLSVFVSAVKRMLMLPVQVSAVEVFANMKRAGKDFSRRITPLFDTMMVQPVEEMGKDSDHPTDSTPIPIIDQPSSSSQPKKKQPSKKAPRQEVEVPQDKAEHEESVPIPSNDLQPSGEDSMQLTDLMVLCTKLQTHVLDLQKAKDDQAKELATFKRRIQMLERKKMSRPTGLKRLRKVGMSRRVESSEDREINETQERQDDDLMFDTGVLEDDEMHVEAKVDGKEEHSTKPDDSTAGEAVTTATVDDSAVPITIEEITLAQTLIQIKEAKPKVVTTAATTTTTTRTKDRGVVVEEPSEF
ncbi:hypothetical protein Tco_1415732, partial [Tanacetum coccineum]